MLFFFKVISVILAIFINLWLQNLDCIVMSWGGFLFSVVCKMRGLVSHILLFIDSDFILSPYEFSHFPYLSFYVKKKNPKMSLPLLVPHHHFLSRHLSWSCHCCVGTRQEEELVALVKQLSHSRGGGVAR